ncbi:MAG TPA: class I SAM-dependent methyltransferase [Acidisarcina sp.]|nr:class I SAM-dependent methyltransferase [Acidisarcina sp.]
MKIDEAAALIHTPLVEWDRPQSWCDLGSGRGTFTRALAQLLAPGSTVYAVDFDASALEGIPDRHKDAEIRKIVGDIESSTLRLPTVDGVLMANTLHFVREQRPLLRRLLTVTDRFLVVEYERSKPNRWGPYPVGFEKLSQLFSGVGVESIERLATRPSLFGGTMYSAVAQRQRPKLGEGPHLPVA